MSSGTGPGGADRPFRGDEKIMREDGSTTRAARGRWIVGGLLLGLVAHSLLSNQPWLPYADGRVWGVVGPDRYALRRRQEAFRGVPFDGITARLSAILPPDVPVGLGPRLAASPFWSQRASEVFYPRRVSQRAGAVLEMDDGTATSATVLGMDPRGWRYVLKGGQPEDGLPVVVREEFALRPLWLLLTIAICLGIGGILISLWNRWWEGEGELQEEATIIACAAALGIAASVLTWLQLPVLQVAFHGLGILGLILLLRQAQGRPTVERIRSAVRGPELWVALAVAGLLLIRFQAAPIAGWDGRSIWLFQAKQVYVTGTFATQDMLHPEFAFAHPEYPKLFPAWLALFAPTGSVWNERMAALGIPFLAAGCIWALVVLAVKVLGRLRGIILVCVLFWSVQDLLLGGYADGYLVFMLVMGSLGFADFRTRGLGWLGLLVASLVKYEGLLLAAPVAVIFSLWHRDMKARPGRWRPMLLFLPALIHMMWGYGMGFKGDFSGIRWSDVWVALGDRAELIGQDMVQAVGRIPIILEAVVSALVGVLLVMTGLVGRSRRGGWEWCTMIVAVVWTASIFGAFLVTPRDIAWHLETALDRLLLHPAALVLTLVLSLTAKSSEAEPVLPASSGQRSCSHT